MTSELKSLDSLLGSIESARELIAAGALSTADVFLELALQLVIKVALTQMVRLTGDFHEVR